jgi:hypothetical protein
MFSLLNFFRINRFPEFLYFTLAIIRRVDLSGSKKVINRLHIKLSTLNYFYFLYFFSDKYYRTIIYSSKSIDLLLIHS